MATIVVNSSKNISAVTYAAGDILQINPSNLAIKAVLTIDAQNPSDVSKLESTPPLSIQIQNNARFEILNTSTTTPLIVKFSALTGSISGSGSYVKFLAKGDWISLGTTTGLDAQQISTVIAGKTIDWPSMIQIEKTPGSGEYISLTNIHGNYSDSNAVVPANKFTFSQVGKNTELGAFFEYNETTNTIVLGSAATGGWVPPAGCNIRIPNIHITSVTSAALSGTSSRFNPLATISEVEWDCVSVSNRTRCGYNQYKSINIKNSAIPAALNISMVEDVYVENSAIASDPYAAQLVNFEIPKYSSFYKNVRFYSGGSGTITIGVAKNSNISDVLICSIARTVTYSRHQIKGLISDVSKKYIKDLRCIGYQLAFTNLKNTKVKNVGYSDNLTGVSSSTNAIPSSYINNCQELLVENYYIIPGGISSYSNVFINENSPRNFAIKNLTGDCSNSNAVFSSPAPSTRQWLSYINFTGSTRVQSLTPNNPSGNGISPQRVMMNSVRSSTGLVNAQSMLTYYDSNTYSGYTTNGNSDQDLELMHLTKHPNGLGCIHMVIGSKSSGYNKISVVSGVENVDFQHKSGALSIYNAGVEMIFESNLPVIGVQSLSGAVLTAATNLNRFFKIRPRGTGAEWPSSWSTYDSSTLNSQFNSMQGYDPEFGFDFMFRIVSTGESLNNNSPRIEGVTLVPNFTTTYTEFSLMNIQNAVVGSNYLFYRKDTGKVLYSGSVKTSNFSVDVPSSITYDYEIPYEVVFRFPGKSQFTQSDTLDLADTTIIVNQQQEWNSVNQDVSQINVDFVNKNIYFDALSEAKTLQDVYQKTNFEASKIENLKYDIPLSSTDGIVYALKTGWSIDFGNQVPTSGTISGGTIKLNSGNYSISCIGSNIELMNSGTYDFGQSSLSGSIHFKNSTGSSATVKIKQGVSYTADPNVTVEVAVEMATAKISNIVPGSRVQIFNVTTNSEVLNQIINQTEYALLYNNGTTYSADDVIRVRLTFCQGLTAKLPVQYTTIASSSGWAVLADQKDDDVYIKNGIDGSTVTEYFADYLNVQIDLSEQDGETTIQRGYAWYCDQMTGDLGIALYFNAFIAEDEFNYLLNTDVLDIKIQNTGTNGVTLSGGAIRRKNGTSPIADGGSIYIYYGRTYALETGTSGLTASESAKLDSAVSIATEARNAAKLAAALSA